jgi:hypothetical protein
MLEIILLIVFIFLFIDILGQIYLSKKLNHFEKKIDEYELRAELFDST